MEQKMMRGIARRAQQSRQREIAEAIRRHPSTARMRRVMQISQAT